MFNVFRASLVLVSALILSACLEVKDKSDDKVVDALNEQNKILQEQINQQANQQSSQAAQAKTSISLLGVVKNSSTGVTAVNATVKIKVGSTFSEPVAAPSGAFQIDNLPADSNYELVVHSTTNSFADRTYFGKTRAANSSGKVYEDVGILTVAVGVERKFKILNAVTNAPITGLTLLANSTVGEGSGYEQYLHKSTYDSSTQEYKIVVPERLGINVYTNLDINNDGKVEYRSDNNSSNSTYLTALDYSNPVYLLDLNANAKVKVRISLVDSLLQPIANAGINVKDEFNGTINGIYESVTNQYVVDAVIDSNLLVMIPSFSSGGVTYTSSSIQISRNLIDERKYSVSVNSSHSYNSTISFDPSATKVFDVVVQPSVFTPFYNLSVVGFSSVVNPVSALFKVFYSGGVELKSDSVSLVKRDVLHVVKGNESSTDLILAGTTLIETINELVPVDTQLLLGKTFLTVTPKAPLVSGNYSFSVNAVTDLSNNLTADLYGDAQDFYVANTNPFSINDLKLDNNDYFTNGAVMKPTNTAGVAANPSPYYWGSYVTIYLPNSIENLKTLVLRKEQVTQNNTTTNSVETYNVVTNGYVSSLYKATVVSLASNENVTGTSSSIVNGAAVPDGQWYTYGSYVSMSDNTNSNSNTVTFSYALETKAGEIKTGTITLPVL